MVAVDSDYMIHDLGSLSGDTAFARLCVAIATIAGAVRIASRLLACCRQATSPHRAQSGALRNFELHPQSAVSPEGQFSQGTGTRPAPSLASSQIYLPDLARQSNPAVRRDALPWKPVEFNPLWGGGELAIRLERMARPAVWQLPIRGSSVPRLSLASMFAAHEALDT